MSLLRSHNAILGRMAVLAGALLLGGMAVAQVHPGLNKYTVDPISFRGPDPPTSALRWGRTSPPSP